MSNPGLITPGDGARRIIRVIRRQI